MLFWGIKLRIRARVRRLGKCISRAFFRLPWHDWNGGGFAVHNVPTFCFVCCAPSKAFTKNPRNPNGLRGNMYVKGIAFCGCYSSSFTTTFLRLSVFRAIGAARKMDESVPKMTPRIIAKAKERMLSPPRKKMQRSTKRVVSDVMMVRHKVLFKDSLNRRRVSRVG